MSRRFEGLELEPYAAGAQSLQLVIEITNMATSKKAPAKKAAAKKAPAKKAPAKKAAAKKSAGKNKLGVKNSLVNNINAKKAKGDSKPESRSTISKKNYEDMEDNWGEKK